MRNAQITRAIQRLKTYKRGVAGSIVILASLLGGPASAQSDIARQSFFVGGEYASVGSSKVMKGQMYVEALIPSRVMHPFPLVLIHGGAQSAMNFMTTPDGRKGWAQWFAENGWKVYLVDVPARGRSAWQPGINGDLIVVPASSVERRFTAPEQFNDYPQAKLHTQWPGSGERKGRIGDIFFDQFYASQVPFLGRAEGEKLTIDASLALLQRIGPSILVVHSQSGLYAWPIADSQPAMVKGIVAIEPNGPPFFDLGSNAETVARPSGLTTTPMTYDPPVTAESPLEFERQSQPDAAALTACWLQKGKSRQLSRLAGIPLLLVTSEASYHAQYDHCTSRFLKDAGVPHDFVRLEDQGIHGNGHMMMLELNNLEIAAFLSSWMANRIK